MLWEIWLYILSAKKRIDNKFLILNDLEYSLFPSGETERIQLDPNRNTCWVSIVLFVSISSLNRNIFDEQKKTSFVCLMRKCSVLMYGMNENIIISSIE